ncbi:MAG: TerB family tellurite resistance protein [Bacteroidales bacterium]|nr:TerB family tellurite resistance protein [Candidatus Scybalocola fimicaballi]
MAKALFNSPRYDKKKENSNGCSVIIFFYPLIVILSTLIGVKLEDWLCIHDLSLWFLFGGLFLPPVIYGIVCLFDSDYKQYLKRINDKKELFHSGDKTAYIVSEGKSVDTKELLFELTLRLLAVIMKADKEERVIEMEVVRSFIYSKYKQSLNTKLNEFKKYLNEDYSVEDVAFAFYWWFGDPEEERYNEYTGLWYKTEDKRKTILRLLFKLAYADGDFCENEEYMLRYIAYHMRLTNNDYESVLFKFLHDNYNYDCDSFKEHVKDYMKTRYKRDGGYWYRDNMGRKQWHSIPKDEDDEANEESKESENAPHIPSELEKAYAVLGIPVDATPSEINACKRNLLRRNHPDLVATRGQEAVDAATAKCQTINQAYELLKANGKC